jgi:hypothetical protein
LLTRCLPQTGEKELKKGSKKTKSTAAQKSAEGESGGDAQAASPVRSCFEFEI